MRRRLLFLLLSPLLLIVALTALVIGILRAANINELTILQSVIGQSTAAETMATYFPLLRLPLQLIFVIVVFVLAWLLSRVSDRLSGWLLKAAQYSPDRTAAGEPSLAQRRRRTVQQLVAGFISFAAYTMAFILAISQFFSLSNLAIVATVATNAFGFAARDYIGDMLNGISNIFENRFNVGDKIAIFRVGDKLEGVVEHVTVRTLGIRTRTGELINVPQGEVRILLNYSRGSYSGIDVICKVAAADLPAAMTELLALGQEAPALLPECIEPWTLVSRDGTLGSAAEIRIHARAQFGYGAGLRLRIMMLVEKRLAAAGIPLA
ncbi:MAG: mechanosensitive ion channel family protein [Candidatus Promineofilum sp.]|nr:mechanosensitive ion channel family protein [Promineifilum sp.]